MALPVKLNINFEILFNWGESFHVNDTCVKARRAGDLFYVVR